MFKTAGIILALIFITITLGCNDAAIVVASNSENQSLQEEVASPVPLY